ncbi:hypothetical protein [Pseudomonas sp. P8_250]|uniref:hypothetical protein n=1 Tax=Pseudomonas sp. P8_250 TaxID=3043446 RepID=UPI002A3599EA|nr:hypothetical protein [Pseudomonas sp. P8_250]MDX9668695.1 hypothetical protein [Pseudomonas sp. P8_250]
MKDHIQPCLFTIPLISGDRWYLLSENTVTIYDEGINDEFVITYPEPEIDFFFATGIWKLYSNIEVLEQDEEDGVAETTATSCSNEKTGAIASDGRSSTYYDISLPNWLIARVLERYEDGRAYIKTEELIEAAFNDDFDAGNAFKSLVRLWGAFNGAGKAGNSVSYEKNKIEYSVGKLEQRYKRQEVAA